MCIPNIYCDYNKYLLQKHDICLVFHLFLQYLTLYIPHYVHYYQIMTLFTLHMYTNVFTVHIHIWCQVTISLLWMGVRDYVMLRLQLEWVQSINFVKWLRFLEFFLQFFPWVHQLQLRADPRIIPLEHCLQAINNAVLFLNWL